MSAVNTAHVYLFEDDSSARAKALAKVLNCLQSGEAACDGCISCRVFESGNHPDVMYVTGTKASIGVDDVREQIIRPMATAPFNYRYKVFIIDKAHTLTVPAQNALLKTIEEPAPYGVFLLITEALEAMLETVRSRCVIIKKPTPPAEGNKEQARGVNSDTDHAYLPPHHALIRELIAAAHTQDILGALALYKKIEPLKDNKQELAAFLDGLYAAYGYELRTSQAPHALRAAKAITHTKEVLSQNGNFQLAIELMLLQIANHIKEGAA